jgi:hypothetical protein
LKRILSWSYSFQEEDDEELLAEPVKPNRSGDQVNLSEPDSGLNQSQNDPFGNYFAARLPYRM